MYGPLLVGDTLWEEVGLTDKTARRAEGSQQWGQVLELTSTTCQR
jgi:hypothetical protein